MKIDIETLRKTKGIGSKTLERIIEQHNLDNNLKAYKSTYKPSETYKVDKDINLWLGNCLELMEHIPDKSVDMILCDLPYGTTACSWDTVIPFEPLWNNYKRIIKDNGAIVLFGSEPFSTKLRSSNLDWYRYDWIWRKSRKTRFTQCNYMPLRETELISVFGETCPTYRPQGLKKFSEIKKIKGNINKAGQNYDNRQLWLAKDYEREYYNYPTEILTYQSLKTTIHPTQKPVELLEYLIKTYTNEDMLVLDNTMGSGSTGVACKNTNRKFIGIELDEEYFNTASKRILDK